MPIMKKILLVFIGGGVGSICRHLISELFTRFDALSFPIATFIANMLGCLIIGLLVGRINLSEKLNLLLVTGFCGGFTTFSTFSKESLFLIRDGNHYLAFGYICTSCLVGIILLWGGYLFSKYFTNKPTKSTVEQ